MIHLKSTLWRFLTGVVTFDALPVAFDNGTSCQVLLARLPQRV
jgi:hypothetical protein